MLIKNLWNRYKHSEFSGNVVSQILGTGIAQAIPFVFTPLLSRVYSEKDFAIFTSFFAIASILVVAVGGKYHLAIVLPKFESRAIRLFTLSNYITIFYAIFIAIVLGLCSLFFNAIEAYYYYLPAYVLFFGLWSALVNYSIRIKEFKFNAKAKVFQSLSYVTIAIVIGFVLTDGYGLVIAKTFAVLGAVFFLSKKMTFSFRVVKFNKLKSVALKYSDYPKYGVFPAFLNTLSSQALILTLTWYYSINELGYFGLTTMVLSTPLGLIGTSYKDVFYQRMASLLINNKYEEAIKTYKNSVLFLAVMGVPIVLVLFFLGEDLFSLIFGEKWRTSGAFASILSFSLLIKLIVSPLSSVFNASNKLRIASIWQVLYFVSTFIMLFISGVWMKVDVYTLLYVYVFHEIVLYTIYLIMQYKSIKK